MKKIEVTSFKEFHEVIEGYADSNFVFRGQSNFEWDLIPKVARPEFRKTVPGIFKEQDIIKAWRRYASHQIHKEPVDTWDWMSLAQHHGLATRLLDWSKNPLVALFFATYGLSEEEDGAVYIYDFGNFVVETDKYDPFDISYSGIFYPKGVTARVINQRGVFSVSHEPSIPLNELRYDRDFIKIKIPKYSKKRIQRNLEQYGLNEFSIYQDLDNLSNYLNRFIISREIENII